MGEPTRTKWVYARMRGLNADGSPKWEECPGCGIRRERLYRVGDIRVRGKKTRKLCQFCIQYIITDNPFAPTKYT